MIICTHFKTYKKGHLQGYADLFIDKWNITIYGCGLYMKDGKRWVSFPMREYEQDGEKKFIPIMRFKDKANHNIFCEQAKKSIDNWCKENI